LAAASQHPLAALCDRPRRLDELVAPLSVAEQVLEVDRLGYRYRFTFYAFEDHLVFALQDKFEDAVAHMTTDLRQSDPGHINFAWYPALVRQSRHWPAHRVVALGP
jgi:hypothetical protein